MTRGHHPTLHPSSTTQPGRRPEEEYSTPVTRYRKLFLVGGKAYHTLLSPGQQNRPTQAQLTEKKHTPALGAPACSSQPPQLGAAKGQAGRVSCRLPYGITAPVPAGAPAHGPASALINTPSPKVFSTWWPLARCKHLTLIKSAPESIHYLWGTTWYPNA